MISSVENTAKNSGHQITKALIFAAGFGKRLVPLTDKIPKPLVDVCGKPLIQYHIDNLAVAGVRDLVINTHWLADKIMDVLGDGSSLGVKIQWSHEPIILNTGGGMQNALSLLGSQPFLVVNADIWTDFAFETLLNRQVDAAGAHLVMVPNPCQHGDGDFFLADNAQLVLEQTDDQTLPRYSYSGIGVYSPGFISGFSGSQEAFPLLEPLKAGIASGNVTAELYTGDWEDIGTLERLDGLRQKLAEQITDRTNNSTDKK